MKKLTKIASFTLLVLITSMFQGLSNESDSLRSALSTETILLLKSPWSESENAAGLHYLDIPRRIGKVSLFYHNEKGDYHRFQNGQENLKYGFFTNGYTSLKKWKFYGDFSYYSENEKEVKWVDVMTPYADNPYTLGDDIGGKYIKEYFDMNTKAAWEANQKLKVGFEVNYQTGVGTRRKDPRPENKATNFKIKPGLIYTFNKFNLGVNLKFETAKEDMEIELVADSTYTIYHFKGLGVFTSTIERDSRSHESMTMGGSLQFGYKGAAFENVTEVSFFQKETDIKRGVSFPMQVVLLEQFQTDVNSIFLFKPDQNSVNKLSVYFSDKRIYGHEPVIEPTQVQENYQWSTVQKYVLYWHNENTFGCNYDFIKLIDKDHFNWGTSLAGKLFTSESSYYFVPEVNKQELNYFQLDASLQKEFAVTFASIILEINGGYRKGFNSNYKLVDDEILLESVNTDFVDTDFSYFNAALAEIGGNLSLGKKLKIYSEWMQMYLSAGYSRQFSQMENNPARDFFNLQLGINF